jgi:hypothetical protein
MNLQITKDELIEKLLVEEVSVTFEKADGTNRVMQCTKMISKIPQEFHPKTEKTIKLDESGNPIESNIITVWDVESNGWRSFNYNKIIDIK